MTYIFEAGSTKTTLLIQNENGIEEISLPGYNPNRKDQSFVDVLKEKIKIPQDAKVYFYGSGLGNEENRKKVAQIFLDNYQIEISAFDDLLGAARALYGDQSGVLAIMGTGGIAAYYDGKDLVRRSGGHGYLIDDIGGGYELGKWILSAWLDERLPREIDRKVTDHIGLPKEHFTPKYYQAPNLQIISELARLLIEHRNEWPLQEIVYNYFKSFFERHILWLCKEYHSNEIAISGGIAENYADIIGAIANELNIKISKILDKPGQALLEFHLANS